MKKILVPALLATCVLAAVHQEASAWINSRFGMGLHWDWQSSNNKLFWGAWKNGNPPGPEAFGGSYGPAYYAPSYAAPYAAPHAFGPMSYDPYAFLPAYGSGYETPSFETYTQPLMPYPSQYADYPRMPYRNYGR